MGAKPKIVPNGTVTSPKGFSAGAVYAGIKTAREHVLDLGILYSHGPCNAAGLFTTNAVKASPVLFCQRTLRDHRAQAVVVNAGCANACTGEQGDKDAAEMAAITANKVGIAVEDVLVASTGVIGKPLPMGLVRTGVGSVALSLEGGHDLALAIMTTDTFPKEIAVSTRINGDRITVGGVAKGAGMIHPNLATLLCFLTTDASVEAGLLQQALQRAVDVSFNMVTVDGDTSTNDTVLLLANGMASGRMIKAGSPQAEAFETALQIVCLHLAKNIARDGEGATKLIEVTVEGAATLDDARRAARVVASSSLVKTAVYGCDPNWGRIMAALGRSGAEVEPTKLDIYLGDLCLVRGGCSSHFNERTARALLAKKEVLVRVCLKLGEVTATAWGCDMSPDYVTINSAYTT